VRAECPPNLSFGRNLLHHLEASCRREWLVTNGIGGFACGTISGLRTRRYHGLLTAALPPPIGRVLVLAEVEAWVETGSQSYPISSHRYHGAIHPNGIHHLHRFNLHPCPTHLYSAGTAVVHRQVWLVPGKNAVLVRYTMASLRGSARLHLIPLFACRDYHALTHVNDALCPHAEKVAEGVYRLMPYPGFPAIYLYSGNAHLVPRPDWYYAFHLSEETARGLDDTEDLWTPGTLVCDLQRGQSITIAISLEPLEDISSEPTEGASVPPPFCEHPLATALWCAAEQFIIRRPQGASIVAGYPWFTDWGRDAMIALRGILLVRGKYSEAREVLGLFARYMRDGLIPNRFPDAGEEPEYNTADATLWFAWMAECYRQQTGDEEFFREEMYPRLKECLHAYTQGTRFGIRVDARDGILRIGEPGWQLTWMDAKVDHHVITPREGKPVEIAALWLNLMEVLADAARRYDDQPTLRQAQEVAIRAREAFMRVFWIPDLHYLADVVDDRGWQDCRLRPNQLLALAIPQPLVSRDMAKQIVRTVERHLLTPFGLRTLAPFDPEYRGRYEGGVYARDSAYHQGTVWTWLLGPYADALLFTLGQTPQTLSRVRGLLRPFEKHLRDGGLGTVSEIFDGDPPHHPRGCFAQAWSVAELLRIWHRTRS